MKSRQTSSFIDLMFEKTQTTLTLYHHAKNKILCIKNKALINHQRTKTVGAGRAFNDRKSKGNGPEEAEIALRENIVQPSRCSPRRANRAAGFTRLAGCYSRRHFARYFTRCPARSMTRSPSSFTKAPFCGAGRISSTTSDGRQSRVPSGVTTIGRLIRIGC